MQFVLIKIQRYTKIITVYDPMKRYYNVPRQQKKAFTITSDLLNNLDKLVRSTFVWTDANHCFPNCLQQPDDFSCGFYVMMSSKASMQPPMSGMSSRQPLTSQSASTWPLMSPIAPQRPLTMPPLPVS